MLAAMHQRVQYIVIRRQLNAIQTKEVGGEKKICNFKTVGVVTLKFGDFIQNLAEDILCLVLVDSDVSRQPFLDTHILQDFTVFALIKT